MTYSDLRKGRHSEPGRHYFVTAATAERQPWFACFELARLVIGEMRVLHEERAVESLAWVLMPDHLHWLFALQQRQTLAHVVNLSSRSINRRLCRSAAVWQPAYHDHALRAEEDIREIARYIVANPLRAGLVRKLADYPHWDAVWL
jgi:putative transposase